MKLYIHRGQKQIGGSIIEISTETTKLIFDVGINLDESEEINVPNINGLFTGEKNYDAVLISHYHPDHIGLTDYLLKDIPLYMGKTAFNILNAANEYRNVETKINPVFFEDKVKFQIGDIEITPFLCDHSAYDSYMFLIENNSKRILYTGDFRANGRMDYEKLLNDLPKVDAIIIEGTTLTREENITNIEEEFLEEIAIKELNKHSGPAFIMMSAMNIDRIITCYEIAQKTNRLFLEDLYTAGIATAVGDNVPNPKTFKNVKTFMIDGNSKRYKKLNEYGNSKISRSAISKQKYFMCIRASMKRYLEKLNALQSFEDGILFYGMWKGYKEQPEMREFLEFMENKGVKIHTLHTSGHADSFTIDKLIRKIQPNIIIPVHTENEEWFEKYKNEAEIICNKKDIEI